MDILDALHTVNDGRHAAKTGYTSDNIVTAMLRVRAGGCRFSNQQYAPLGPSLQPAAFWSLSMPLRTQAGPAISFNRIRVEMSLLIHCKVMKIANTVSILIMAPLSKSWSSLPIPGCRQGLVAHDHYGPRHSGVPSASALLQRHECRTSSAEQEIWPSAANVPEKLGCRHY